MKQAAASEPDLVSRIRAVLNGPDITEQRMFGGVCFMLNGNMVAGTLRNELLVRVGKDGNDAALARPHTHPMEMGRPAPATSWSPPRAPGATPTSNPGWTRRWPTSPRCRPRRRPRRGRRPPGPPPVVADAAGWPPGTAHACKIELESGCFGGSPRARRDRQSRPTPDTPPRGPWRRSGCRDAPAPRRSPRRARRGARSPSSSPRSTAAHRRP